MFISAGWHDAVRMTVDLFTVKLMVKIILILLNKSYVAPGCALMKVIDKNKHFATKTII